MRPFLKVSAYACVLAFTGNCAKPDAQTTKSSVNEASPRIEPLNLAAEYQVAFDNFTIDLENSKYVHESRVIKNLIRLEAQAHIDIKSIPTVVKAAAENVGIAIGFLELDATVDILAGGHFAKDGGCQDFVYLNDHGVFLLDITKKYESASNWVAQFTEDQDLRVGAAGELCVDKDKRLFYVNNRGEFGMPYYSNEVIFDLMVQRAMIEDPSSEDGTNLTLTNGGVTAAAKARNFLNNIDPNVLAKASQNFRRLEAIAAPPVVTDPRVLRLSNEIVEILSDSPPPLRLSSKTKSTGAAEMTEWTRNLVRHDDAVQPSLLKSSQPSKQIQAEVSESVEAQVKKAREKTALEEDSAALEAAMQRDRANSIFVMFAKKAEAEALAGKGGKYAELQLRNARKLRGH